MKNWFLFYVNMTYVPKLRNSKLKTKVCHFMNARVQTSKLSKKKTIISNLKMTIMLCQTSQRIIEFTRGNQHYYQPQWFHLQNLQLDIIWIVWSKRKEPTLTMNDLREKNDAWTTDCNCSINVYEELQQRIFKSCQWKMPIIGSTMWKQSIWMYFLS